MTNGLPFVYYAITMVITMPWVLAETQWANCHLHEVFLALLLNSRCRFIIPSIFRFFFPTDSKTYGLIHTGFSLRRQRFQNESLSESVLFSEWVWAVGVPRGAGRWHAESPARLTQPDIASHPGNKNHKADHYFSKKSINKRNKFKSVSHIVINNTTQTYSKAR